MVKKPKYNLDNLEENFKMLLYDLGERNWNIITKEAWDKYINRHEPFTEAQLQDIKDFLERLEESDAV